MFQIEKKYRKEHSDSRFMKLSPFYQNLHTTALVIGHISSLTKSINKLSNSFWI